MPITVFHTRPDGIGALRDVVTVHRQGHSTEVHDGYLIVRDRAGDGIGGHAAGTWQDWREDQLDLPAAAGEDMERHVVTAISAKPQRHPDGGWAYTGRELVRAYARGHLDGVDSIAAQ